MPQSLAQVYLHVVFSTKNRIPFLKDKPLRAGMHAYLAGACNGLGSPALKVGGVEDHVHILCRLSRTIAMADLVKGVKQESSKWVKGRDAGLGDFYWQDGYGAFSVSPSHLARLEAYIENQEAHHRREDFQQEFLRLLKKYGVEYDERYVLD